MLDRGWARRKGSQDVPTGATASRECWGRGCLRGAPAAPLSEAPYCQQSLSSPLSDQGLPLGSSLPHGAPDVDTEWGWPLQSTAGSWHPGIFNSFPDPTVCMLLSPLYRGESCGSKRHWARPGSHS